MLIPSDKKIICFINSRIYGKNNEPNFLSFSDSIIVSNQIDFHWVFFPLLDQQYLNKITQLPI